MSIAPSIFGPPGRGRPPAKTPDSIGAESAGRWRRDTVILAVKDSGGRLVWQSAETLGAFPRQYSAGPTREST